MREHSIILKQLYGQDAIEFFVSNKGDQKIVTIFIECLEDAKEILLKRTNIKYSREHECYSEQVRIAIQIFKERCGLTKW